MDLLPTQRQVELRDGLRALLASHAMSERHARDSSGPGDDTGLWSDLVSGGWATVGFPEAFGGRGGGVGDLVVVAETLGGGHVLTPFQGGIVLCGQALLATPGEGDRLRALLTGERTYTYCSWEGFEQPGERPPAVEATETPSGWRLDGLARFVPYADVVDELLVLAAASGGGDAPGPTLFAVPGSSAGLTTQPVPTVGGDRCSHIRFRAVEVDAAQVVGPVGGAMQWLPRVLDIGRVVLAAEMVGAAAAALSHATDWATTRVQFNAPIGSFQAVQQRLADASIDVVTAQDSVYDAAGIIDRGEEPRVAAAAAKAYCGEACRRVTAAAHQMCGGEGIYADQPLHRWHRRVAALVPVLGSVRYLRAIVAASILPG
jgi:alkylation response protein AidB-like acyl-CoA dehydrogenase